MAAGGAGKVSVLLPTYEERHNLPLVVWLLVRTFQDRYGGAGGVVERGVSARGAALSAPGGAPVGKSPPAPRWGRAGRAAKPGTALK